MGHGKETPRQKMIGMMYLVLTALLALNVSAEILNAFVLVDESLLKSGENIMKKNERVYTEFEKAYQDPGTRAKAEPWKKKADQVKILSQGLVDEMQNLKYDIVKTADKTSADYEKNGPKAVKSKDDNNIPAQIMILNKKGNELKKKIEEYRAALIAHIDDQKKYENLVTAINATMNTDDMEAHGDGGKVPWEIGNFEHLPLSAVLTMLSKMQSDVRNAEADMLAFLLSQIDAGTFKFNRLEAIVNAPSNYVLQGGKYTAEVFLAASDSTTQPEIYLDNGSQLKNKDGKGQYEAGAGTVGFSKWGGKIKIKSPATGEMLEFPFKAEYQVGAASLVVSPTKMNVFYIGVPNPVDISVSGVPDDKINAVLQGDGSITKQNGSTYTVLVKKPGEVKISVTATFDKETKDMGSKAFRVKRVPDPVAKVANMKEGIIGKNLLMAQTGVVADLENFDFDLKFKISQFTVSTTIKGYSEEAKSTSNLVTPQQRDLISKATSGKKVYFENIKAVGPDGTERSLGAIVFKIQ